jgi:hypothetical protein
MTIRTSRILPHVLSDWVELGDLSQVDPGTSGMNRLHVLLLLRQLQREFGMAVIFVTHDVGTCVEVGGDVCRALRGDGTGGRRDPRPAASLHVEAARFHRFRLLPGSSARSDPGNAADLE